MNGLSTKAEWSENLEKQAFNQIEKIHLFNFTNE